MWYSINSVWKLLLIMNFVAKTKPQPLVFSINEESPINHVVGKIDSHINLYHHIGSYEANLRSAYFRISNNNVLVVNAKIDLENLCLQSKICCGTDTCYINETIYLATKESFKNRLDVQVEIKDINDNEPMFFTATQSLSILENSGSTTSIPISGAMDKDHSSVNQILKYSFVDPTQTFDLNQNDITNLMITLQKSLDYETQNVYYVKLFACDEKTCTGQNVTIYVRDVNDNYPKFEQKQYRKSIREDFPPNSVILRVHAVDRDGPQFNQTSYRFHQMQQPFLRETFRINSSTGDIILLKRLSSKEMLKYSFKIIAADLDFSTADQQDTTDVEIIVIDINDHKPVIEAFPSPNFHKFGSHYKLNLPENQEPQKLLMFTVTDDDLGENKRVDCAIQGDKSTFELTNFDGQMYELFSKRRFNYEVETSAQTVFICKDHGKPQLSNSVSIEVEIEDVNEFSPRFKQLEFVAHLNENTPPNQDVLQVKATDEDGGAVLRYHLDTRVKSYFTIDQYTGVIRTGSTSFDRERDTEKTFTIFVTDSLKNPRTASTEVKVIISDINDNDPIFVPSSLVFSVSENLPVNTQLMGQLSAEDRDIDNINRHFTFSLLQTYDHNMVKCDRPVFRVTAMGKIETLVVLDRESTTNYTLLVKVKDSGQPARWTTANVSISVKDENDNPPQWIYPRSPEPNNPNVNPSLLPMLNLSESTEEMTLILRLKAYDPDENEAGRVSYYLLAQHESLFYLNDSTGELITCKSPLPFGQYQLRLTAKDHGIPPKQNDTWILINIIDSGKLANINLTIIIGMTAITFLIAIFLIVGIICVRRRPRFHQSYLAPSSETIKDTPNQYFNPNQFMYIPDDSRIPLSDNDSIMFYQMQLQSNNGSRPESRADYSIILPSSKNTSGPEITYGSQAQNLERYGGTLRSNNGVYCPAVPSSIAFVSVGHEYDGESADSGKGASEVDLRLQQHLSMRNYTTMPFSQYTTPTTTTFGHNNNNNSNYYEFQSHTTNPRTFDSRYLHTSTNTLPISRRVASPSVSSSSHNCQCFRLPEDDVIQIKSDDNSIHMSTFANHCHYPQLVGNDEDAYVYNTECDGLSNATNFNHNIYSEPLPPPVNENSVNHISERFGSDFRIADIGKGGVSKTNNPFGSDKAVPDSSLYSTELTS